MKPLKVLLPLLLLLFSSLQQANASVTSQSCYDNYRSGTYYPPEVISTTCTTDSSYAMAGTVALLNYSNGSPLTTINITGVLSQNKTLTTETSGYSYGNLHTTMTFDVTGLGTYSMSRLDTMSWGITTVGAVSNSITGGLTTDSTTQWDIWADGINALAHTLDGDSDGKIGINLYVNGVKSYVADVHLSAVPLPAAFWLFGSGLAGLVSVVKRRGREFVISMGGSPKLHKRKIV